MLANLFEERGLYRPVLLEICQIFPLIGEVLSIPCPARYGFTSSATSLLSTFRLETWAVTVCNTKDDQALQKLLSQQQPLLFWRANSLTPAPKFAAFT